MSPYRIVLQIPQSKWDFNFLAEQVSKSASFFLRVKRVEKIAVKKSKSHSGCEIGTDSPSCHRKSTKNWWIILKITIKRDVTMRQTDSKCYIIIMLTGMALCLVSILQFLCFALGVWILKFTREVMWGSQNWILYFSCVYMCFFEFINFRLKCKCFIKGLFYMFIGSRL